jgi:hypothetical protein
VGGQGDESETSAAWLAAASELEAIAEGVSAIAAVCGVVGFAPGAAFFGGAAVGLWGNVWYGNHEGNRLRALGK